MLKNKELPWKDRDHGLFVAFAPYHAPRFAISVIIEHGGSGSGIPARIARDTMEYLLKNKKLKDEYTELSKKVQGFASQEDLAEWRKEKEAKDLEIQKLKEIITILLISVYLFLRLNQRNYLNY